MPSGQIKTRRSHRSDPVDRPGKLPPCEGPKLGIFPDYRSPITWLDRLDNINDKVNEAAKKAYVFKVKIKSKLYALKIFREFDPYQDYQYWEAIVESAQEVEWHTSPFYAECRAYGRIKEALAQGALTEDPAIPCFGYVILTDTDRMELEKKGIDTEGSIMSDSGDESSSSWESRSLPLGSHGIVKKLVSSETSLGEADVRRMQKDIQQLNKLRIYNTEIKKCNYKGGKLFGFGSSWTEPHCYIVPDNSLAAQQTRDRDMVMFDKMLEKEEVITRWRTTPNRTYKQRLRANSGGIRNLYPGLP